MDLLKQSTAATIKMGPFLDDADGKTAETGLTISQADIRLSKNGGDFAQTNNAAGATHDESGYYDVPLDTTDTSTLGRLRVAISEAGALPVWQDFLVVPGAVYDALVSGTGNGVRADVQAMAANVLTASALATDAVTEIQSGLALAADLATVDTNVDAILADTGTDGVVVAAGSKSGYVLSSAGVQAIWDALSSALTTANSIGKRLVDYVTGDAFGRLGAPAGASVSADIAAVKAETAAILDDTGTSGVKVAAAQIAVKKNTALAGFTFVMYDSADHLTPKTGLTVTATRSIDGGAFGACANAVSEIGSGAYKLDLAAGDLNGNVIMLKFSATGADTSFVALLTQA